MINCVLSVVLGEVVLHAMLLWEMIMAGVEKQINYVVNYVYQSYVFSILTRVLLPIMWCGTGIIGIKNLVKINDRQLSRSQFDLFPASHYIVTSSVQPPCPASGGHLCDND